MSALRLSDAAERLQAARIAPRAERRRFRRLPITLSGRMLGPLGAEIDCRTEDISPGDVRITTSAEINPDDRVVIYLDKIGRISGTVARVSGEREYAIIFDMSAYKREKLAEQLTIMIAGAAAQDGDRKIRTPRPHRDGKAEIDVHIDGGGIIIGEVVDFSLVGMTIRTTQVPPRLGAWVRVSNVDGRIARFTEDGFAIDFESRIR
ncbi:MAG: hypothetical protein GC206_08215 [Alphaproteobacteria bacterium]|nr:hypothetical protein [Alphaproteobacteria bacterium]